MNKDRSEDPNKFRSKSLSTENSSNYNITWKQNNYIVSPMNEISVDRWPFRMKDETEEEFKNRMEILKSS